MQNAVDAEADECEVTLGFDVDVAGPLPKRGSQQIVHGLDDVALRLGVGFLRHLDPRLQVPDLARIHELDLGRLDGGPELVVVVDEPVYVLARGQENLVRQVADALHVLPEFRLEGVEDRQLQLPVADHDGHQGVHARETFGNGLGGHFQVQVKGVDPAKLDALPLGHRLQDDVLGDARFRQARLPRGLSDIETDQVVDAVRAFRVDAVPGRVVHDDLGLGRADLARVGQDLQQVGQGIDNPSGAQTIHCSHLCAWPGCGLWFRWSNIPPRAGWKGLSRPAPPPPRGPRSCPRSSPRP